MTQIPNQSSRLIHAHKPARQQTPQRYTRTLYLRVLVYLCVCVCVSVYV